MGSSVLPAIITGLIAVAIITAIIYSVVIIPLSGSAIRIRIPQFSLARYRTKNSLRIIEQELRSFQEHVNIGDFASADTNLKKTIDAACSLAALTPEGVVGQLLGALSHILSLAEKHQIHIENLELVEELIHDRGSLLRGVIEAERSRLALKKRRSEGGKDVPEWAVLELKKQFETLGDQLHTNHLSLQSQFGEALQAIVKARSRVAMTVH